MRKVNIVAMATMLLAIATVVTDLVRASATVDRGKAATVQVQAASVTTVSRFDPI